MSSVIPGAGGGVAAQQVLPVCGPGCLGGVYTVQPGDTMFTIARRFGVSLDALVRCNPQIPDPNLLFPGQQLCLPGGAAPACSPACQGGIYIVQPGDTMFTIAARLGVSLDALIACNPQVPNPSLIFPGQALCTPTGGAPVCGPGCMGGIYVVRPGDSMFIIAARLGVTLDQLLTCNPQVTNPNLIFPGQRLCIPGVAPLVDPCCVRLQPGAPMPGSNAMGVALVRRLVLPGPDNTAATVAAWGVAAPSEFGDFDAYEAVALAGGVEHRFRLFATGEAQPTWAGTRTDLPPLPLSTWILVRPLNTQTEAPGPVQLAGSLGRCFAG